MIDETVTVTEAASLLRVNVSTIRRWIRQGSLPAFRVGQRRLALKRADLAKLITPASDGGTRTDHGERPEVHLLTAEESRNALAALDRIERMQLDILAKRGGRPFSPSWELINKARDERTRQRS